MNKYKNFLALVLLLITSSCVICMNKDTVMKESNDKSDSSFVSIIRFHINNNKNGIKNGKICCQIGGKATKLPLLHAASLWGDRDAARLLLSSGVDIKERDENGRTAIEYSVSQGNADVVFELLCCGALGFGENIKTLPLAGERRKLFRTIFDATWMSDCIESRTMTFRTFERFFSVIHTYPLRGMHVLGDHSDDKSIKKELDSLKCGMEYRNTKSSFEPFISSTSLGCNILDCAVSEGFVDVCECLLRVGYGVGRVDFGRNGPLYWAVYYKNLDILNLLLKYGAYSFKNLWGESPLDLAIKKWYEAKTSQEKGIFYSMIKALEKK